MLRGFTLNVLGWHMTNAERLAALREIVGADLYQAVIDVLAGTKIYFPNDTMHPDKVARDQAIKRDFANGFTYDQLAERYAVARSTVHRVLSG